MKNWTAKAFFLLLLIISSSCDKEETPVLSSANAITAFIISGEEGTIDNSAKSILVGVPLGTDLTSLSPEITISAGATVTPASGTAQDFTNPVTYTVTAEDGTSVDYTATVETQPCADASNIYTFTYDGKTYELVRENKSWVNAAACAVERGGYLSEINDANEQNVIFAELQNASIVNDNTIASDGGNRPYVWIGGNDLATEGSWVWDGNNDNTATDFWLGDASGSPVNGLYNNWGNEPDNFGAGQDALGLALTDWPLGVAGQWNDVEADNALYFLIEYN